MRVLLVHNYYQQRGGEDMVVEAESALLENNGHIVERYFRYNDELAGGNAMQKAGAAAGTFWSRRTVADISRLVGSFRPDVIHVHNTFPLISPSLFHAADRAGVPIVQTLHNFRLFCPQAMFLRDGAVCEKCLGKIPLAGVINRCYRDSTVQSAVLGGMLVFHRSLGTYRRLVTRYIALNDFCRDKFIAGGLPAERIAVKANFINPPPRSEIGQRGGGLFVGRLSGEKGIKVLLGALSLLPETVRVKVLGSGPLADRLTIESRVQALGLQPLPVIMDAMNKAAFLLMPSIWYENFPRTLVEAFACGLPVIASRLGAMAELVEHQRTGLLFEPGNPVALAEAISWAEANPGAMRQMGENARAEFEAKYTPEINLRQLETIYADALSTIGKRSA